MVKRTISADGRILLPKVILKSVNIEGSTKVYVTAKGEDIVISKYVNICALCGSKENLIEGFPICRSCAQKAADLLKLS